jgi:hypothetical protein
MKLISAVGSEYSVTEWSEYSQRTTRPVVRVTAATVGIPSRW